LEKSVSIDNQRVRDQLNEINVVAVPTITLLYNNQIIDRIVGEEPIEQWIYTTLYNLRHVSADSSTDSSPLEDFSYQPSSSSSTTTPIESIPFEPDTTTVEEPSVHPVSQQKEMSAMELAKKMQTQRETFLSKTSTASNNLPRT